MEAEDSLVALDTVMRRNHIRIPWLVEDVSLKDYHRALMQLAGSEEVAAVADSVHTVLSQIRKQNIEESTVTLNLALKVYQTASAFRPAYAARALSLLTEWKQTAEKNSPDIISYNTCIAAFANAKDYRGAERTFQMMASDGFTPDQASYGALMKSYAVSGRTGDAEALFHQMKRDGPHPTVEICNELLYTYKEDSGRAREFLLWWAKEEEDTAPNARSYNIVLHSICQHESINEARAWFQLMPHKDQCSVTTLANALAEVSLEEVRSLVDDAHKNPTIHVDSSFLANIIYALARSENPLAPPLAEEFVQDLIDARLDSPDVNVYNALFFCWSTCSENAQSRVLEILHELERQPSFAPDIKTYTNVLNCLARSRERGGQLEAERIIRRMERNGPRPNTQAYTALIRNYARSKSPSKAVKAAQVLQRMKQSKDPATRPNIVSYNTVLNAAEFSDASNQVVADEALRVSCETFDEIRNAPVSANHITYGSFLGALARLMPVDARQEISELVFRRCCKEGQVSPLVLRKLKEATADNDRFVDVLLEGFDEDDLPACWTRHVQESPARATH